MVRFVTKGEYPQWSHCGPKGILPNGPNALGGPSALRTCSRFGLNAPRKDYVRRFVRAFGALLAPVLLYL